ncbi:hypothetical protein E1A91_A08G209400v1 [Gossypium mustelinum]|uniref:Uncharacterized protein n=1 Tax=Gossypium mustelinum TaxID=34275 RepID=A0A5D2YEY2_GOSMU|nr:hypothetical protein E1A91_A08G209400v1 [Gossypium mustelinum]
MSYRFHFCKTFSISRSSSRQILHAAVSFPIFLSVSGSHSSSQGKKKRLVKTQKLIKVEVLIKKIYFQKQEKMKARRNG